MIGSQIRKYREKQGFSQQELADAVHVSQQTINKWENGQAFPQADRLEEIAAVLRCPVSFLIYEDSDDLCHAIFVDKTSEWKEKLESLRKKGTLSMVEKYEVFCLEEKLSGERCGYSLLFTDREYELLKGMQNINPQISAEQFLGTIRKGIRSRITQPMSSKAEEGFKIIPATTENIMTALGLSNNVR